MGKRKAMVSNIVSVQNLHIRENSRIIHSKEKGKSKMIVDIIIKEAF